MTTVANKEALLIAKQQLEKADYDMETTTNKGLFTIAANKAAMLSKLIMMAENYYDFHWVSCSYTKPENVLENVDKRAIQCLVAIYKNNKYTVEIRVRKYTRFGGWKWSGSNSSYITHWAVIPLPGTRP